MPASAVASNGGGGEGASGSGRTVGFIGAGRIGMPMVERLLAAGHHVRLYARRAEIREQAVALGAQVVPEPTGIAASDVVICSLFSDAQLAEVLPAIVRAMPATAVLVSHTTGDPEHLAGLAAEGPVSVVDAPFSGTAEIVRAGRLTVLLGGEPAAVAVARDVVAAYAGSIIETGGPGSGLRVKLLNNVLFAGISQLTLMAVEAGRAMGVAEDSLLAALDVCSGGSTAGRHIALRGGAEQFAAAVAPFLRKDVAACQEVAAGLKIDLTDLVAAAGAGPIDLVPHGTGPAQG